MNSALRNLTNLAFALGLAAGTGLVTWWLMGGGPKLGGPGATTAKPEPPASVSKPLKETDLILVTLKPEAEQRLGLKVVPVERRAVPRTRSYAGEVMIPPGQALAVTAPLSGVVRATGAQRIRAGQKVTKGQQLVVFTPVLSPDARTNLATALVDAEGQIKSAKSNVDATTIALNRAKQLFSQEAGSRRTVDEATAQSELARKALEAAEARRDLLAKVARDADAGAATSQVIAAPATGMIRNVQALAGETVAAGTVLFEIIMLDTLWVRVPAYVGDLDEIDTRADAGIGTLGARPGASALQARPAAAPPSANPTAATVDLYYELFNADQRFAPGQRVGATLALKGEANSLAVPWSAVLHDIHGGTWVYEQLEPHRYARRRVIVDRLAGEWALLSAGPAEGTKVVAVGVAELFGTEVGFAK